mmetsp:Transcript_4544/g.16576  ORF Transcript_4544/g.16576 Transcript_4544/m.16576 type:complete len:201 (+) Transcript_4544:350-952(+)
MSCSNLTRSESAWHENGVFSTHAVSTIRVLIHLFSICNQMMGLMAHAKKDVKKADMHFWGWIVYTVLCIFLEIFRLSTISADVKSFSEGSLDHCLSMFTNSTDTDPRVIACMEYDSTYYKSFAYFYGIFYLFLGLGLNAYFALVARSYWYYLHDDRLVALGQSIQDESLIPLTPLEQQALGGDGNVYVKMDNLFGHSRNW